MIKCKFYKLLIVLGYTIAIAVTTETETKDNDKTRKELWLNYNLNQIWVHHGCDYVHAKGVERPIHNITTWKMLRKAYEDAVGKSKSSLLDEPAEFDSLNLEARQTPNKGRGQFATSDIPKGTLMYDYRRAAQFFDGPSYRKFMFSIRPDLACDVLIWQYLYQFQDGTSQFAIMVDLDDGSFCNDGEDEANVGWGKTSFSEYNYNRMPRIYSLRDISAGEEILCHYDEFSYDSEETYALFGL